MISGTSRKGTGRRRQVWSAPWTWFGVLAADHRFVSLDGFLGFSVGGITVPVETLMTKLVVRCYHGRGQPTKASHFSDSLAALSCFAVTYGVIVGPVSRGVLVDELVRTHL